MDLVKKIDAKLNWVTTVRCLAHGAGHYELSTRYGKAYQLLSQAKLKELGIDLRAPIGWRSLTV